MGLGSTILNAFTNSWGSNTGVMQSGGGRVIKSLVTSGNGRLGGFGSNSTNVNGLKASELIESNSGSFGVSTKIKEMLENYPLTTLFLSIYESIIGDIISKSELECKIENADDALVEDINEYLKQLDYKRFLTINLRKSLYWGSYGAPIFMDKATGHFKLGEFLQSEKFIPAYYEGKLKSYVYKDDSLSEEGFTTGLDSENIIQVPADEMVYVGFKMYRKIPVVLNKEQKKGIDKILVNLNYRFASGILDDCLYLIYNHLLTTYIRQLLTLKNSLRPDVLMATAADDDQSITETSDDIENIEACLNNNESGVILGLFGGDPSAMLTNITSSVLNQLKVVPGLNNMRSYDLLDFPALEDKLAKLAQDLQDLKIQCGLNLGIPEELLNSSSNRWEVVSRSATFEHAINKVLSDISSSIKQTVINYTEKYHKVTLTQDDINITFDTNNILFNAEYASKQELINNKLESFTRMVSNSSQIKEDPNVNKYEWDMWFADTIGVLDPTLKKIFAPPPLPTVIDPMTGQQMPPEQVISMIQQGMIDPVTGQPLPPPGQEMPPEEGFQ